MFAIQPAAWSKLDEYGCEYTPTSQGAYTIARQWVKDYNEDVMIYRLTSGAPIKWVRVTHGEVVLSAANAPF